MENQSDQALRDTLELSRLQFINEFFEQAEVAKELPQKMFENAVIYRTLEEINEVLYKEADRLANIDDEPIAAYEFAQTVQDVFDEIRERIQMRYETELTELKYKAFPWDQEL
jgi:hypothetical protein